MSKLKLSCCIAVAFVLLSVSSLYAGTVAVDLTQYSTGTRTSGQTDKMGKGGGITATGPWDNGGFELSWRIADNKDGTYSYKYRITGLAGGNLAKDVKHWILQLSPSIDWTGVFDGIGVRTQVGQFKANGSNKGMPSDLFGLKFKDGTLEVSFVTDYAPEWGDFYAYGGKVGKGSNRVDVFAYNTGFGTAPAGPDFINWIPVDGIYSVPEPSTLILLLSSMGVLGGVVRFRKKT